jgi:hypothetical protein
LRATLGCAARLSGRESHEGAPNFQRVSAHCHDVFRLSSATLRPKLGQRIKLKCYDKILAVLPRRFAASEFPYKELEEEWRAKQFWK